MTDRPLDALVPPAWRDDFVLALRLRDVPGAAIGDALAQVESHCLDSGQTAEDAFGPAAAYARSLPPAGPAERDRSRALLGALAPAVVLIAGAQLVLAALAGWGTGRAALGADAVVVLLGAPLAAVALVAVLGRTVGGRHPRVWFAVTGEVAAAGLFAGAVALSGVTLVALPVGWALGTGAVALAAGAAGLLRTLRGADPVVAPEPGQRP